PLPSGEREPIPSIQIDPAPALHFDLAGLPEIGNPLAGEGVPVARLDFLAVEGGRAAWAAVENDAVEFFVVLDHLRAAPELLGVDPNFFLGRHLLGYSPG